MTDLVRLIAVWLPAYRACAALAGSSVMVAAGGAWLRASQLLVAVALGGCAALPGHVARPASTACLADATTTLARVVAASTPGDVDGRSGFRLLRQGEEAFQNRLALIGAAQRTLDVPYDPIAVDRTGLDFLKALREVAARGVRVMVDDLHASGEADLFAGLAALPNL